MYGECTAVLQYLVSKVVCNSAVIDEGRTPNELNTGTRKKCLRIHACIAHENHCIPNSAAYSNVEYECAGTGILPIKM